MLDPSVVLSKGIKHDRISLAPTAPEVILDGANAGCSTVVLAGPVLAADVGNDCQLVTGVWSEFTKGQTVTVAASKRLALRDGGAPGGTLLTAPVWA